MRAAFRVVDIVRESFFVNFKFLGIAHGNFHENSVFLPCRVKYILVFGHSAIREVFYIRSQAAFEIKCVSFKPACRAFCGFTRVNKREFYSLRQIRLLAQVLKNSLFVELNFFEYFRIGFKYNCGAGLTARANLFHLVLWFSAAVFLLVFRAVAGYIRLQIYRKRVYDRYAYSMQAARNLIRARTKLPSRVQYGEYGFEGGFFGLRMLLYGNSAAVIRYFYAA